MRCNARVGYKEKGPLVNCARVSLKKSKQQLFIQFPDLKMER